MSDPKSLKQLDVMAQALADGDIHSLLQFCGAKLSKTTAVLYVYGSFARQQNLAVLDVRKQIFMNDRLWSDYLEELRKMYVTE